MRAGKFQLAHKFQTFLITCLESALLAFIGTGGIQAQNVTYSGNLQFSTGSYFFTERTESFYFTNGLSISGDRARVSFSIPYIVQNSPWISYGPDGGIPTGGTGHGQVDRRGSGTVNQDQDMMRRGRHRIDIPDTVSYRQASFSDPSVNGSLRIYNSSLRNTNLNLNASVKIPFTNPASGFGTGAWDFGAGLSLFHRIRTMFFFSDIMYWKMGDMDELELNNPLSVSVGTGKAFRDGKWMLSASFLGSTKIIDTVDPPMSLNIGLGHFISTGTSLNGSVSIGLSESSPDFSAGVGWSIQF
jgi:hypothetical protein